jgi:outer membrane receptor for ferrienterochelin and colicins
MTNTLTVVIVFFYLSLYSSYMLAEEQKFDIYSLTLEELLKLKVSEAAVGYEQNIENAPATVSIILREEWQAMGATELYQVLETVPGVNISVSDLALQTPTIIMRGLGKNGSYVKVLINGQSFTDRTRSKTHNVGHFPLTGFKRIEVIKGPGSVIYGADAYAGIVNLVTEDAGVADNNHVTVKSGRYDMKDVALNYAGHSGKFKWHGSAQFLQSDLTERKVDADAQTGMDLAPFSALTPPASNAPGFLQDWHKGTNLMAQLSYEAFSLEFFNWQEKEGRVLGITKRLDDPDKPVSFSQLRQSNLKLSYNLDTLSSAIPGKLKMELTYEDAKEVSNHIVFPAGAVIFIGDDGNLFSQGSYPTILTGHGLFKTFALNTLVQNIKINHVFNLVENHGIRWEVGYETLDFTPEMTSPYGIGVTDSETLPRPEDGSPLVIGAIGSNVDLTNSPENMFMVPAKQDFWFLSVQDEWQPIKAVNLVLGVRFDNYSNFGSTTNPRVGLNWQASNKVKLKVFAGSAFRAPSLGELYSTNNPLVEGNENLQPENIETIEMGINLDFIKEANLSLSATIYRFKEDNIIRDLPTSVEGRFQTQNGQGEIGRGIELEALWQPISELSFKVNYAKSEVISTLDQSDITHIPDTLIYMNANWRITPFINWNLGVKHVGGRQRLANDLRAAIADYTRLSTRLSWTNSRDDLILAISGSNITDEYVSEPGPEFLINDFPMQGALYKAELIFRF